MAIAREMAIKSISGTSETVRVLDPCSGPGTFARAIADASPGVEYTYVELDPVYFNESKKTAADLGLSARGVLGDYLKLSSNLGVFDAVIMNPPYVRHELIDPNDKALYRSMFSAEVQSGLDGRANLMAYFCLAALRNLRIGGNAVFLLYGAYKYTRYGKVLDAIMAQQLEDMEARVVPTPFDGAIVDGLILTGKKRIAPAAKMLLSSDGLSNGMIEIGDLFDVSRGTAIPNRGDYVLSGSEASGSTGVLQMLLKSTRANISSPLPNAKVRINHPDHPQSIRPKTGALAMNYYFRAPPRHFWINHRFPVSDNYYLLQNKTPIQSELWWLLMNSDGVRLTFFESARQQGNGLHKLQTFEYRAHAIPDLHLVPRAILSRYLKVAKQLIANNAVDSEVFIAANKFFKCVERYVLENV